MKKFLSFLFICLLAFLFVGCGDKPDDNKPTGDVTNYSLTISDADKTVSLEVGAEKIITATFEGGTLEWVSSDSTVVSVDNGTLKALKAGTATITVSLKEKAEYKVTISVTVTEAAPAVVEVTGLALSGKKAEVKVGEEFTVVATVTPSNATDKTVTWASSDATVATVTDGKVKALKVGTTEISATAGSKTEKFTLTVKEEEPEVVLATEIYVDPGKQVLHIGETDDTAYAEVDLDATDQVVVWSTSNESVVTVDQNGKVTAVGPGTAEIIATTHDGTNLSDSYQVLVYNDVTEMTISGRSQMYMFDSQKLSLTVNKDSASDFTWTSSDTNVATVDPATGSVTSVAAGSVKIKCKANDSTGMEKEFDITIVDVAVTSIDIKGEHNMEPNTTQTLTAKGNLDNRPPFKWTSSDPTIATVDENGLVSALKNGVVKITCEVQDSGKFSVEFEVIVASIQITIGEKAYATVEAALAEAKSGDVILVSKGTYSSSINVPAATNNVTIQGDDTLFTGSITVEDGVDGLTFKNIILKEKATVIAAAKENATGIKNVTFDNVQYITAASGDDASIHFYVPCENFKFVNCYFDFTTARGIRFESSIHNLTIDNCKFVNSGGGHYDTVRGMDLVDGDVIITNNLFENCVQTLIQFRYIGAGTYNVLDNVFKNAACASLDMREAKENNFEGKAVINVKYNVFDGGANAWGTIRLRNSWGSAAAGAVGGPLDDPTQVEINFNYNVFKNIVFGDNKYYVDKCTGHCTEKTFNIDYNYSDMGEPQASWFSGMDKSFEGWFSSEEALNAAMAKAKLNEDDNTLLVGTMEGITKQTYESLAKALEAAKEGNVIVLLPGAYTGDVKITVNNLTITTLNGNYIPGQLVTRFDEATYNGKITLAKELKGLTIKGIKFIGTSQIVNEKGAEGTTATQATDININGFNFINNLVETAANTGTAFIYFEESKCSYSHDINISNNKFTTVSGFNGRAIIWIDNNYNFVACDNVFNDVTLVDKNADNPKLAAIYVNDVTKGLSGEFSTINSNIFKNITGSGIWINWLSPLPAGTDTCVVSIQNNSFETVTEYGIYLGKMNNTDKYASIKVMFNSFKGVKNCLHFLRVTGDAHVTAKYNKFYDIPTGYYANNDSANQSTSGGVSLDLTECLFLNNDALVTPDAAKFAGDVAFTTTIKSEDDLPGFDAKATAIKINAVDIFVGDEHQFTVTYTPKNTTNVGVEWESSDPTVATITPTGVLKALKAGTVTITATYQLNGEIQDSLTLTITDFREVVLYAEGNGFLKPEDELDITASIFGSNTTGEIEWSSSDATVATVTNGKVKALKAGKVTITAKIKGTEIATNLVLEVNELSEMDELMKLLVSGHRSVVEYQTINYIGYESGYEKVPHKVYTSVNAYYAAAMPTVVQNRNAHVLENTSGTMESVEYVVVHDSGSASPGADGKAISNWALNAGNDSTSYHYSVGNDGIYQQLDENVKAWHAGDGITRAGMGSTVKFYDTGVTADPDLRNRAVVTISNDGYFVVNGTKTTIAIPAGATAANGTNRLGLGTIVKDGKYWIPDTYVNSTYDNKICIWGGGTNGVGIESCANTGSDIYLTWQYLAKLVADILIRNNLTPDRIFFHNNFSNKTCPNTMINSDNIDMFLDMCYLEYYIKKNYSDYTITFTSNNPDVIDNTGRVIGAGPYKATNVSYTITITKGNDTKTVTLNSLVQGSHKH